MQHRIIRRTQNPCITMYGVVSYGAKLGVFTNPSMQQVGLSMLCTWDQLLPNTLQAKPKYPQFSPHDKLNMAVSRVLLSVICKL